MIYIRSYSSNSELIQITLLWEQDELAVRMSTSHTESVYKVDILTVLLTLCELISESVNVTLWGFHTARVSRV